MTSLLAARGHRHIALLNGRPGLGFCSRRQRGYAQALTEFGQKVDPGLIANGQMTEQYGYEQAMRMLRREDGPRPTAFVTSNTRIALGVICACSALDLNVPKDVSVVGVCSG